MRDFFVYKFQKITPLMERKSQYTKNGLSYASVIILSSAQL
nr:MAG TPA: hypothetical protein [Caudoviricetes sp.]DAO71785.1 MAG TPA: hypothetical protein [Caudoviricetes sp.]DAO71788.1 MAG TPA: hypothetical protein [Caudoviricetes sp.]DAZ62320.1 MAG TPA: hypothetical protein [Caudoviricetes sp.]